MKTFTVYEHPHFGRQAVKEGFIWPAFFFSFIWAWFKGMVAVGFVLLGANIVISLVAGVMFSGIHESFAFLACLVWWVIIGFWASEWRGNHLKKKGYKLVDAVNQNATVAGNAQENPDSDNSKPVHLIAAFASAVLLGVGALPANAKTTWRIDSDDYLTVVRGQTDLECKQGFAHASFFDSSKNFVRRELIEIIAGTFEVYFFDEVDKSKLRTMRLDCVF